MVSANRPGILVRLREFRLQPYRKASALLFLAFSPPPIRELFFAAHPFETEGRRLWKSLGKLEAFLQEVRRKGYAQVALDDEEWFRVAAPVFAGNGKIIGAIGGYFEHHVSGRSAKRLASLCRTVAATVSTKLEADV